MNHSKPFIVPARLLVLLLALLLPVQALERVSGANATLESLAGTRAAALGGVALPLPADLPALSANPWQLAELRESELAFAHVSYYEDTWYDYAAMGWPLGSAGTLGLAASRFGADGIPLLREGDPLPSGEDYETFSLSDWVITGAWGRSFGKLALGISAHALRRELDQSGWGFRSDLAARYTLHPRLEVSALLQGWTSSAARWESGQAEYSPPEIKLGLHGSEDFPYFYGTAHLYWQSAGLLHRENRSFAWEGDLFDTTLSSVDTAGGTLWQDPLDWLSGGGLGLEFTTSAGLSLRAGLQSLGDLQTWTAGAGLRPLPWLQADYAFQSHPVLSGTHRVAIALFPGLLMRPGAQPATPKPISAPQAETPTQKADIPSPPEQAPKATPDVKPAEGPAPAEEPTGETWWEE